MCLKRFSCCPCLTRSALTLIVFHNVIFCVMTRYILYLNMLGYSVISYETIQWVEFLTLVFVSSEHILKLCPKLLVK